MPKPSLPNSEPAAPPTPSPGHSPPAGLRPLAVRPVAVAQPVAGPDGVILVLTASKSLSTGAAPLPAPAIAVSSPPIGIRVKGQSRVTKVALGWVLWLSLSLSPARPDSLWVDGLSRSLVSDKRAYAVGDILHILVQENTSASKNNNTKTSKKSDLDAKLTTLFYSPAASSLLTKGGQMPALKFGSSSSFDGGGRIDNSERIAARIAVVVVDTLPNGNLVVEGRRQTVIGGETQDIVLRGLVRPADINPNNTVYSYNVAQATIRLVSKGVVSDSQRKGWFHRLWDKITPF